MKRTALLLLAVLLCIGIFGCSEAQQAQDTFDRSPEGRMIGMTFQDVENVFGPFSMVYLEEGWIPMYIFSGTNIGFYFSDVKTPDNWSKMLRNGNNLIPAAVAQYAVQSDDVCTGVAGRIREFGISSDEVSNLAKYLDTYKLGHYDTTSNTVFTVTNTDQTRNVYIFTSKGSKTISPDDQMRVMKAGAATIEENAKIVRMDLPAKNGITIGNVDTVNVGDMITFGVYEQDNDPSDKEDILWVVLDLDGDRILLLSKYILDSRVFQDNHPSRKMPSKAVPIKWADCTLRAWLNEDFIQTAFSVQAQELLCTTHLVTKKNQGISGGPDTDDKVFLLSIQEVERYLSNAALRGAVKTEFAKKRSDVSREKLNWWWLRSPGLYADCPAIVLDNGKYKEKFTNPENGYSGETTWIGRGAWYDIGVRPAVWIDLSTLSDN